MYCIVKTQVLLMFWMIKCFNVPWKARRVTVIGFRVQQQFLLNEMVTKEFHMNCRLCMHRNTFRTKNKGERREVKGKYMEKDTRLIYFMT